MNNKRILRMCGLAVLLLHSTGTQRAIAAQYNIDILINPYHPEMFDSWLFGINNEGQTTGYTVTKNVANHFVQNVVTYRAGTAQTLFTGATGGLGTSGIAISAEGDVVGNANNQLTFFPAGGGSTPIAVPGFEFPTACGVNASGSVLIDDSPSDLYYNATRFALWKSGTSQRIMALESLYPYTLPPDPNDFNSGPSTSAYSRQITGLNDAGQFAASVITNANDPRDPNNPNDDVYTEQYAYAYVFNGHDGYSLLQPPTPGVEIDPISIDAIGTVLGWAGNHLALWGLDGAVESVLPDPPTSLKHVPGIAYTTVERNGLGQIVAITATAGIEFYDPASSAWIDITPSINGLGTSTFSTIQGFNDRGQFVGLVRPPQGGGVFGYVVSPVPEPSSLAICMCGLAFAAGSRRHRARQTNLPAVFCLAAAMLLMLVADRAEAITYKASLLNPTGYNNTDAIGISGNSIVGGGTPISGDGGAFLLNDATHNVVELNPTGWALQVTGVSGTSQVGNGNGPTTGGNSHAVLWHGSAASLVDLHPSGLSNSFAQGASGDEQVGFGYAPGSPSHALLWHGTAASVVDLHPAGFIGSISYNAFGNDIVGLGQTASGEQALLWQGANHNVVNLHSAAFPQTFATDVSADSQVGTGVISPFAGGERHALLWHGTAASLIDLQPTGFTQTDALGVAGTFQIGFGQGTATGGKQHALLWHGSAASVVDLNSFLVGLGHTFIGSAALDIGANGVIVGDASDSNNIVYAVKWTPIIPGDFNDDAIVDSADYVVWRKSLGTTYTQSDYNVWRTQFGQTAGSGAGAGAAPADAAVPEPSSVVELLACAVVGIALCARRTRVKAISDIAPNDGVAGALSIYGRHANFNSLTKR